MFRWGIIFLVIALIAAALGFGGLAGTAAGCGENCLCRRHYPVPGQPVYWTSPSIAMHYSDSDTENQSLRLAFSHLSTRGDVRYCLNMTTGWRSINGLSPRQPGAANEAQFDNEDLA
jgi:hypothetical protein